MDFLVSRWVGSISFFLSGTCAITEMMYEFYLLPLTVLFGVIAISFKVDLDSSIVKRDIIRLTKQKGTGGTK